MPQCACRCQETLWESVLSFNSVEIRSLFCCTVYSSQTGLGSSWQLSHPCFCFYLRNSASTSGSYYRHVLAHLVLLHGFQGLTGLSSAFTISAFTYWKSGETAINFHGVIYIFSSEYKSYCHFAVQSDIFHFFFMVSVQDFRLKASHSNSNILGEKD